MESDESPTANNPDEAAWVAEQRQVVLEYLVSQRCNHGGVSIEPRWFVWPYVAVWAIRSHSNPDLAGWWAVYGDLPTDYMIASGQKSAGDVLITFATRWRAASERMRRGEHMDEYIVGDPSQAEQLAPLLRTRADLLTQFGEELNGNESVAGG